jgi:ferritin-like metal-binding protein YciE
LQALSSPGAGTAFLRVTADRTLGSVDAVGTIAMRYRIARNGEQARIVLSGRPLTDNLEELMSLFGKDIETMDNLFVHTLQDIYYAEKQILKALPEMEQKASSPQLKTAFKSHLEETKGHVKRLEQVFKMHGHEPKGVDCPAIDGIIEETNDIASDVDDKNVLDAALAAAAQAVEHYEMSRYGTLVAWAKQLGRPDCASVLEETLKEEKAADMKLTKIAESQLNQRAAV